MNGDLIRAGISLFVSNVVKVIVLLGGFDIDGAGQLLIIGTVDSGLAVFFLLYKNGQQAGPALAAKLIQIGRDTPPATQLVDTAGGVVSPEVKP